MDEKISTTYNDTNIQENQYEYNSYSSRTISTLNIWGCNLLDTYKPETVKQIVSDPMENNRELRQLSQIVYNNNGIVTNTIDYMVALPTLDNVVICYGKDKKKSKFFKETTEKLLRKFKDKEFVRDAMLRLLVDGVAFYYFETSAKSNDFKKYLSDYDVDRIVEINAAPNASFVSLNPDCTRIVGIKNSSYILAFDLNYFNDGTGESTEAKLRKYPKEIREAYHQYATNNRASNWFVLDNNHTVAVKFRAKKQEPWGRPLVLAALQDILFNDYFIDTKRNVLDEVNNRIYYQTFPEGEKKGKSALSTNQQREQHNAVREGIMGKNNRGGVSFFSVAAGTKIDSLNTNIDLLDEKNESTLRSNISTSVGFAGSLLSGSGDSSFSSQEGNLRLVTAEIFNIIELITYELNKVINAFIGGDDNNSIEVYYLPITHANRSDMVGFAKDLYLQGKGSLSLWAAASGIAPKAFFALLDEELELDIEEKYPVHQTSATLSSKSADDDKGGRPQMDNPTNSNTIKSKTNNSNNVPKPKQ